MRESDAPRGGGGRKRDDALDDALLGAALDVLVEVGAAGLTMDAVAARVGAGKATIYRRWASKDHLIVDAVARVKRSHASLHALPDTGTLRGDLLGLFKPLSVEEGLRQMKLMAALSTLLAQAPALADAIDSAVVDPWVEANLALMQRAVARGEVSAAADIATTARVIPAMAAYRGLVQRKAFDLDFLTTMVDAVVLPALNQFTQPNQPK